MSACPRCGTERTLSGYCGAQGAWEVCALRAELRDLREANARMACDVIELRAAVLAVADQMVGFSVRGWAAELREAAEK